jgi:hypothetical protein
MQKPEPRRYAWTCSRTTFRLFELKALSVLR